MDMTIDQTNSIDDSELIKNYVDKIADFNRQHNWSLHRDGEQERLCYIPNKQLGYGVLLVNDDGSPLLNMVDDEFYFGYDTAYDLLVHFGAPQLEKVVELYWVKQFDLFTDKQPVRVLI